MAGLETSGLNLTVEKKHTMDLSSDNINNNSSSEAISKVSPSVSQSFSIANILGQTEVQNSRKSDEILRGAEAEAGSSSTQESKLEDVVCEKDDIELDITDDEAEEIGDDGTDEELKNSSLLETENEGNRATTSEAILFPQTPLYPSAAMTSSLLPGLSSISVHPGAPLNYLEMMNSGIWAAYSQNYINRQLFGLNGEYMYFN